MTRWPLLLSLFLCLGLVPLAAVPAADIPAGISASPSEVKQGNQAYTSIQIVVALRAPARDYFICEVKSADRRRIDCKSIIIKKGDRGGIGKGIVYWKNIPVDAKVRLTAYNVDSPMNTVFCTVSLKAKTDADSE